MSKEEILKYAAEAIEKQIPKKPNIYGDGYDDDGNLILTLTDNTTLDAGNISAISDRVSVSKPLATAAVSVSVTSLLWNIVTLVVAIVRKRKVI